MRKFDSKRDTCMSGAQHRIIIGPSHRGVCVVCNETFVSLDGDLWVDDNYPYTIVSFDVFVS